jgi:CRISPR/Cas system-associated exonuclease Cas4 (RecB family)
MGQAIKAGQIVNLLKSEEEAPDRIALVLADEKLLLPVLYALPNELGPVNVTMGYPLKYTHLYHLASLLFQMQDNAEKFAEQRKSTSKSFYVKDILKILAHPYLLFSEGADQPKEISIEKISESIRLKNRVFLAPGEIMKLSGGNEPDLYELLKTLFSPWDNPVQALDGTLGVIGMIRDKMIAEGQERPGDRQADLEYLFHFSKIIRRCRTMMEMYPFIRNLKTLRKILFQLLDSFRMPFTGEPLQGLQVMGVLETRAIDFENLVVLSVNEGILPAGRAPNSFIPFDIKKEFGLPTYLQKDSVFAYHFYRMIQRARRIFLLYDTEGDQMKGGEKSRFITQLGYELKKYNPDTVFEESLLGPRSPSSLKDKSITMAKTPAIITRLMEKADKGFSPSSLNLFIRCPLQFYFQEMLGLSEVETVEETIEAKTMGTVIHSVFQQVYEPFTGKFADPSSLLERTHETEQYLREAFKREYLEGDLDHGKNHLIFKASLFLINQFIKQEAEDLQARDNPASSLKILELERNYKSRVSCIVSGKETEVSIRGKTDRVDMLDGITRIIDYKTGSVSAADLKLKSWDKLTSDPKMSKAFQLLVYAWLFYRNQEIKNRQIETGNITLRKISEGFMKVKLPEEQEIGEESMEIFEGMLKALLEKILDPQIPFTQTDDVENCTYCPFTAICTR